MSATLITDTTPICRQLASRESDWKELAGRQNEGLEISLLWSKSADRVKVTVVDSKFDEEFVLDVAGADALAAFNHPFAYLPSPSFGSVEAGRGSLNLHSQA